MSDVTTIEADVPERYADAVSTRLQRAADEDVVGRIWRKDGTLWAPEGTPEVTNRLGWLDIADREREQARRLPRVRRGACARRATRDAVVLGHGRLEPRARGLPRSPSASSTRGLTLHVLDSTHPQQVARCLDTLDLDQALMIVSIEVRRDDRADVDVQGLPRAPARRLALRRGHRSRHRASRSWRPSRRLPRASSTATRTSAGATARCRRSGSSPAAAAGIDVAGGAGLRDRRRRGVPRRAAATPACGSAARSASSPARAATSSRSSPTRR